MQLTCRNRCQALAESRYSEKHQSQSPVNELSTIIMTICRIADRLRDQSDNVVSLIRHNISIDCWCWRSTIYRGHRKSRCCVISNCCVQMMIMDSFCASAARPPVRRLIRSTTHYFLLLYLFVSSWKVESRQVVWVADRIYTTAIKHSCFRLCSGGMGPLCIVVYADVYTGQCFCTEEILPICSSYTVES